MGGGGRELSNPSTSTRIVEYRAVPAPHDALHTCLITWMMGREDLRPELGQSGSANGPTHPIKHAGNLTTSRNSSEARSSLCSSTVTRVRLCEYDPPVRAARPQPPALRRWLADYSLLALNNFAPFSSKAERNKRIRPSHR